MSLGIRKSTLSHYWFMESALLPWPKKNKTKMLINCLVRLAVSGAAWFIYCPSLFLEDGTPRLAVSRVTAPTALQNGPSPRGHVALPVHSPEQADRTKDATWGPVQPTAQVMPRTRLLAQRAARTEIQARLRNNKKCAGWGCRSWGRAACRIRPPGARPF